MSNKRNDDFNVVEPTENVAVEEAPKEMQGVVSECLKLNVRKEPSKESEVLAVLSCCSELLVNLEASTDDWYAVCTASGVEGFCMKKFVNVTPLIIQVEQ